MVVEVGGNTKKLNTSAVKMKFLPTAGGKEINSQPHEADGVVAPGRILHAYRRMMAGVKFGLTELMRLASRSRHAISTRITPAKTNGPVGHSPRISGGALAPS